MVSFGLTDGPKQVHISQVVTERDLLQRSQNLEDAMKNNMVVEFCQQKIELSDTDREQQLWNFLKVSLNNRQADGQTDRQTNRQTDRQTDRQTMKIYDAIVCGIQWTLVGLLFRSGGTSMQHEVVILTKDALPDMFWHNAVVKNSYMTILLTSVC